MAIQMNGGLSGLLGKLIGKPESPQGGTQAAAGAMTQQATPLGAAAAEALKKGTPLGDGTLIAGLGYTGKDKAAAEKNAAERDNIQRFVKEPEISKLLRYGKADEAQPDKPTQNERQDAKAEDARPGETRDARADARREDHVDENRAPAQQEAPREEPRAERAPMQEDREEQRPDDNGQGRQRDGRDDEDEQPRGPHERDVLGDGTRCRHVFGDHGRCLMKPIAGTNYCREHALQVE